MAVPSIDCLTGVTQMMMKKISVFTGILLLCAMSGAGAEQSRSFDDYTVHYSAFTTDVLSPAIAKSYRITRSKNRALLNISILKKVMGTSGKPVQAKVEATTTNLSKQLRQLDVRELLEPGAVYYLAESPVNNGETLEYTVSITPEDADTTYTFSFKQQFVTDY